MGEEAAPRCLTLHGHHARVLIVCVCVREEGAQNDGERGYCVRPGGIIATERTNIESYEFPQFPTTLTVINSFSCN